ncbi:MAG: hypothetical protein H0X39_00025 [Actinobacteria bacterium]|nr:hypothetical protein [Actinomycetota bacterium]
MKNLTVVIPWDKRNANWLEIALASLPEGIPYVICPNDSKAEMTQQLNDAFEAIETEYVFIMGADDALTPTCLRHLAEAIGTADVAYPTLADYDIYSQNRLREARQSDEWPRVKAALDAAGLDDQVIAPGDDLANEIVLEAEPPAFWNLQDINHLPGCFLAKTSTLRAVPQPDLLLEDWAWHFKALAMGARYVPVKSAVYLYRARHDSLSNRIEAAVEADGGNYGPIRWAIRESVYSELFADDTEADPAGRVPLAATFQVSASEAQAYLRGILPARYLPGAVHHNVLDSRNVDKTPATIMLHPGVKAERLLVPLLRDQGKRVIVDVDDDYLSPSLVGWLRKCGAHAIADSWVENQPAHRRVVRDADSIICATPPLAYQYAKVNPNVVVIPNMVDPADWEAPLRIDDGIIRVGWAAAAQHTPDVYLVEPALRWASEQPGVMVCCIGMDPGFDFAYRHFPYTRSLQHYRDLVSILDVGLAPLHASRMNDGKSDLKWLDYTMGGALTIASAQPAYATIRSGDTGLLAKTQLQFRDHLQFALADPQATHEMIANARRYVLTERLAVRMRNVYLATCGVDPYPIRPLPVRQAVAA